MANWQVYIVRCADGSLYTGVTTDVSRRLDEHNQGGRKAARYTRSRKPVVLVYCEMSESRANACRREWEIKQMPKADKERLIVSATE